MDEELKKKVIGHYQAGQGSIQDIARVYRLDVDEVLEILGINDISHVSLGGDLIDPEDVGPGGVFNPGETRKIKYSTD